jgi:hypothetical protein
MERAGDREEKMEGYCSTGQSPQWAVVPVEEEEEVKVVHPYSVDIFVHFVSPSKINSRDMSNNIDRFYEENFSFFEVKHKKKEFGHSLGCRYIPKTRKIETELCVNGTSDFVTLDLTQNVKSL